MFCATNLFVARVCEFPLFALGKSDAALSEIPIHFREVFDQHIRLENVPVLLQLSDKHDNAVLNLGALSVPGSAAPQQLRVMRSIAHRGQLLRVMATLQSAPVDALAAADQYVLESNMLIEHLSEMNRYFAERGITFSKSEQGKFAYTRYE